MIAVSTREEWDYVLLEERSSENPTVFRLRPLSLRDRNAAYDLSGRFSEQNVPYGTWATTVVRGGLAGWKNLGDGKGGEVRFAVDRGGKVREELLEVLPMPVCLELASEIITHSQITEDDRKN